MMDVDTRKVVLPGTGTPGVTGLGNCSSNQPSGTGMTNAASETRTPGSSSL